MNVGVKLQVWRETRAAMHNGAVHLVQSGELWRCVVPVVAMSVNVR